MPTRAQLESLEHDEREAVIHSAVDQRLADLARLRRSTAIRNGRTNSNGTILALRASIRRLIARAAEFDIRVTLQRPL
jgi:hypothetical protein